MRSLLTWCLECVQKDGPLFMRSSAAQLAPLVTAQDYSLPLSGWQLLSNATRGRSRGFNDHE